MSMTIAMMMRLLSGTMPIKTPKAQKAKIEEDLMHIARQPSRW